MNERGALRQSAIPTTDDRAMAVSMSSTVGPQPFQSPDPSAE
jgi:hypothetical protein